MKRKLIGAVIAIAVIIGAGYLGGVAYSRHVFAEQLDKTIAQLNASPDLTVEKQQLSRGFFHTEGLLLIGLSKLAAGPQPVQLSLPFRARHGILSTAFDGNLDVKTGPGKYLFSDYLSPGKKIDLKARIANLEGSGTLILTLPAIELDDNTQRLALHGGVLNVSGQPDDMTVEGRLQTFSFKDDSATLALGPARFSSHQGHEKCILDTDQAVSEPQGSGGQARCSRDELTLDSLTLRGVNTLPMAFSDIHYIGQTRHAQGALRYLLHLTIGDISISQQRLGSARLSASLDRINAEAASRLFAGLQNRLAKRNQDAVPDSRADWLTLIEPQEQAFFAMLKPSPRLRLDSLNVESPMLDQPLQLEGNMIFDGTNIEQMHVDALRNEQGMQAFIARLHGDFTLNNAPPLLALIAGVAPDQRTLNITFDNGTLSINDQPWYSLD